MTDRILGAPFTDMERAAVVVAARKRLGMRWRHQGRRDTAADCIGYAWLVFSDVRVLPAPRTDYGRTPSMRKLWQGMVDHFGEPAWKGKRATMDDLRVADVVTLRWTGEEQHLAIVTDHPGYGFGLIHADNHAPGQAGPRVVEHGLSDDWLRRITGVFRP